MDLPESIKQTLYIELTDSGNVAISCYDCLPDGWIHLGTHEVVIQIPDIESEEIVKKRVTNIEGAMNKLQADTEVKMEAMRETIQSLLAIENQSE